MASSSFQRVKITDIKTGIMEHEVVYYDEEVVLIFAFLLIVVLLPRVQSKVKQK